MALSRFATDLGLKLALRNRLKIDQDVCGDNNFNSQKPKVAATKSTES